jgi:hypothetical protein
MTQSLPEAKVKWIPTSPEADNRFWHEGSHKRLGKFRGLHLWTSDDQDVWLDRLGTRGFIRGASLCPREVVDELCFQWLRSRGLITDETVKEMA